MPAIMVGTAMMAAHPASRFMSSFWETAISDRLASSAVVSSSRSVSTRSLIRITWSYTSRKYARTSSGIRSLSQRVSRLQTSISGEIARLMSTSPRLSR